MSKQSIITPHEARKNLIRTIAEYQQKLNKCRSQVEPLKKRVSELTKEINATGKMLVMLQVQLKNMPAEPEVDGAEPTNVIQLSDYLPAD